MVRKEWKKAFEDFADYKVFKQNVLEMVSDIDDQITSKEYNKRLRNREEGYNQYTFRFILQHVDNEDRYDKKAIIRNIKNQSFYEAFFMYQIANLMISGDFDQLVTDKEKERCLSCAKNTVLELCQGRRDVYYAETALIFPFSVSLEINVPGACGSIVFNRRTGILAYLAG